jgi:hypothetical protein
VEPSSARLDDFPLGLGKPEAGLNLAERDGIHVDPVAVDVGGR